MKLSRTLFFPLLFAFILLFAQQAGAAHALHHAMNDLVQQQDKQAPHSGSCEKCADYAQLGSALNAATYDFIPPLVSGTTALLCAPEFRSVHVLSAAARAPPYPA